MKKYFVYLIILGFGAWCYNEHKKQTKTNKPKIKK
jgi:hypothetical protein